MLQKMGKNLLQAIGKDVAMILDLEDAESYTGHCWRRSVATHVAGQGVSTLDMKRQFGWRQDTTAMKYIDSTTSQCLKMASLTTGQSITVEKTNNQSKDVSNSEAKVYNITMGDNCTLNLN